MIRLATAAHAARNVALVAMLGACGTLPAPADAPLADAAGLPEPAPIEVGVVPPPGPYAPGFDVIRYDIDIEVPATGTRIGAVARLAIALVEPRQDTLRLDLTGLRVLHVLTGTGGAASNRSTFRQAGGKLIVPVPSGARTGDTIQVDVSYGGEPDDGLILRANVHGQHGAFGDNWPNRARFWFPSIDHPSDKATVTWRVRAPAGWHVIANGRRFEGARPVAATAMQGSGTTRAELATPPRDGVWQFHMPVPIPTYLMVIGATPFSIGTVTDCARGGITAARAGPCVPVSSWAFPTDSASAARSFRRGGDMVEFYSRILAPFPYTNLAHVQSATRFGGMENASAIFYSERAIADGRDIEGTVAHEVAHQWFGDAVTPRDWAHLWLSEGFASYFGPLYFEHADGVERFREIMAGVRRGYLESDVTNLAVVDTLAVPGNNLLELLNA
ncbi:MAG TPA: M1 family aminopeptidase, partial [Longimicrobiales bacterium]|nr:M1 family aminopeptidase [Longimicrobiales bacterium]